MPFVWNSFSVGMLAPKRDEILGGNKKGGHTGRPISNREETSAPRRYFFSSAGFSVAGGAGACVGGVGVCVAPEMPSLKLPMPSPNPFMISGILLPPEKINKTARTTSPLKTLNSPMHRLLA